jgi:hypothetical protein
VLWLGGYNLVGSIPSSLVWLSNLTDLEVSMNALTGSTQPDIAGLMSAVSIKLYNNPQELWQADRAQEHGRRRSDRNR